MPVAGVDTGSMAAKAVVYDPQTSRCLSWAVLPTGWNPREAGEAVLAEACRKACLGREDLNFIAGTGYGRADADAEQLKVRIEAFLERLE